VTLIGLREIPVGELQPLKVGLKERFVIRQKSFD